MDMPALDVAIGMIFLYLLLSLIVTTLQEAIATGLRWRAENLYNAVANLLEDPKLPDEWRGLAIELYKHPLVEKLCRGALGKGGDVRTFGAANARRLPSYLPSRTFAIALLDVLRKKSKLLEASGADTLLAQARVVVQALPDGRLKASLVLLVNDADALGANVQERAEGVSARIEQWFNDAMARASGWYKRRAQAWSFGLGLALAIALNANTFEVATRLWDDSALRASVVAGAEALAARGETPAGAELGKELNQELAALRASKLPIGWTAAAWNNLRAPSGSGLFMLAGWVTTALAISLGAAFWFDVLGRALQIRGSGQKISAATGKPEDREA
jgi:hypothetical protein